MMNRIAFTLFFAATSAASLVAASYVSFDFEPGAALRAVTLLGQATDFPEIAKEGYVEGKTPSWAKCMAGAYRAAMGEGMAIAKDNPTGAPNGLFCQFGYDSAGAKTGTLTLDLNEVPIGFFGNRFQRGTPFRFQGAVARKLYSLLKQAKESNPGDVYFKEGRELHLQWASLAHRPPTQLRDGSSQPSNNAIDCTSGLMSNGEIECVFERFLE
jgi:hypothetical protein